MSFVWQYTAIGMLQQVPKPPRIRISYEDYDLPETSRRGNCYITEAEKYHVTVLQAQRKSWTEIIQSLRERRMSAAREASENPSAVAEQDGAMADATSDGEARDEDIEMDDLEIDVGHDEETGADQDRMEGIESDIAAMSDDDETLTNKVDRTKPTISSATGIGVDGQVNSQDKDTQMLDVGHAGEEDYITHSNAAVQKSRVLRSRSTRSTAISKTRSFKRHANTNKNLEESNELFRPDDHALDSISDDETPEKSKSKTHAVRTDTVSQKHTRTTSSSSLSSVSPVPEPQPEASGNGKASNNGGKRHLWSKEEKEVLVESQAAGLSWPEIAQKVGNGRSAHACTTQWSTMRKQGKIDESKSAKGMKERWSEEDDEKLLRLHNEGKDMKKILEEFPERGTIGALYARLNKLKEQQAREDSPAENDGAGRTRKKWTRDEEARLVALLRNGANQTEIQAEFPSRNPPALKKKCVELRAREKIPAARTVLAQNAQSVQATEKAQVTQNAQSSPNASSPDIPSSTINHTSTQSAAPPSFDAPEEDLHMADADPTEAPPVIAPIAPVHTRTTRAAARAQASKVNGVPIPVSTPDAVLQNPPVKASSVKVSTVAPAVPTTASTRAPSARLLHSRETGVMSATTTNPYARQYSTSQKSRRAKQAEDVTTNASEFESTSVKAAAGEITSVTASQKVKEATSEVPAPQKRLANQALPQKLRLNPPKPPISLVESGKGIYHGRSVQKVKLNPPKPIEEPKERSLEQSVPKPGEFWSKEETDKLISLLKRGVDATDMEDLFAGRSLKSIRHKIKHLKDTNPDAVALDSTTAETLVESALEKQTEDVIEDQPATKKPRGRPKKSVKHTSIAKSTATERTQTEEQVTIAQPSTKTATASSSELISITTQQTDTGGRTTRAQKRKQIEDAATVKSTDAHSEIEKPEPRNKRMKTTDLKPELKNVKISSAGKRKAVEGPPVEKNTEVLKKGNAKVSGVKRQKIAATRPTIAEDEALEASMSIAAQVNEVGARKTRNASKISDSATMAGNAALGNTASDTGNKSSEAPISSTKVKSAPSSKAPASKSITSKKPALRKKAQKYAEKYPDWSAEEVDSDDEVPARVTPEYVTRRFKKSAQTEATEKAAKEKEAPKVAAAPVVPRAGVQNRRHAAAAPTIRIIPPTPRKPTAKNDTKAKTQEDGKLKVREDPRLKGKEKATPKGEKKPIFTFRAQSQLNRPLERSERRTVKEECIYREVYDPLWYPKRRGQYCFFKQFSGEPFKGVSVLERLAVQDRSGGPYANFVNTTTPATIFQEATASTSGVRALHKHKPAVGDVDASAAPIPTSVSTPVTVNEAAPATSFGVQTRSKRKATGHVELQPPVKKAKKEKTEAEYNEEERKYRSRRMKQIRFSNRSCGPDWSGADLVEMEAGFKDGHFVTTEEQLRRRHKEMLDAGMAMRERAAQRTQRTQAMMRGAMKIHAEMAAKASRAAAEVKVKIEVA